MHHNTIWKKTTKNDIHRRNLIVTFKLEIPYSYYTKLCDKACSQICEGHDF